MIDVSPPFVWLENFVNGSVVSGLIEFSAGVFDDKDVVRVDFFVDGVLIGSDSVEPFSVLWDSSRVSDGVHLMVFRALDSSSNSGYVSYVIVVDNTAPVILDVSSSVDFGVVSISVNVSDANLDYVSVWYRFNGGFWSVVNASFMDDLWFVNISIPQAGLLEFYVTAFDKGGNSVSSEISSLWVEVDEPPTIISVTWAPQQPKEGENLTVTAQVIDDYGVSQVILSYYNGSWVNVSIVFDSSLGAYVAVVPGLPAGSSLFFRVIAVDSSGQQVSSELFVVYFSSQPRTGETGVSQSSSNVPSGVISFEGLLVVGVRVVVSSLAGLGLALVVWRRK